MFTYQVVLIFSSSICIPAIIGAIRFKKIISSFLPIVYYIWLGLISDIINIILSHRIGNNAISSNIYVLVEGLMLIWLFYEWNVQTRNGKHLFLIITSILLMVWVLDNFYLNPITRFNSIYRILYSLVIVFLSINHLNLCIISEREALLKNAGFLVSLGFIIFFSYRTVIEVFYMYDFKMSVSFYNGLFDILIIVNLVCNLIYAAAIAWIPTRQKFTLPF